VIDVVVLKAGTSPARGKINVWGVNTFFGVTYLKMPSNLIGCKHWPFSYTLYRILFAVPLSWGHGHSIVSNRWLVEKSHGSSGVHLDL